MRRYIGLGIFALILSIVTVANFGCSDQITTQPVTTHAGDGTAVAQATWGEIKALFIEQPDTSKVDKGLPDGGWCVDLFAGDKFMYDREDVLVLTFGNNGVDDSYTNIYIFDTEWADWFVANFASALNPATGAYDLNPKMINQIYTTIVGDNPPLAKTWGEIKAMFKPKPKPDH